MKIIYLIVLALFISITSACHTHDGHESSSEHSHANEASTEEHSADESTGIVELSQAQLESIQLQTGSVEQKQLTASLKANGFLKVPNQNRANATAVLGGTVSAIHVQSGSTVRKGQPLVTITNPSFIHLQEEWLTVTESVQLATIELNRQKELQQGNANAVKTVQQAEADLRKLQIRKASLASQLQLIGISSEHLHKENIRSSVDILSPISGSVSEVNVNMGSYADPNTTIAEVVDHSQLHLDLFVFEKDLEKLRVGQTIHFTLTNNPGKEYDAKVFGISNTFEPETRAIAVHAAVEGNKSGLIDGMSITALVSLDKATVDAVPTEAIVNYQGLDYIFLAEDMPSTSYEHQHADKNPSDHSQGSTGTQRFVKVPIRKGTTEVGYSEITPLEKIPAEARIVTKGAFFLMAKLTNQGEGHAH